MPRDNRVNLIVTGANSGVGFGICQRILTQLSITHPSDMDPSTSSLHAQAKQRGLRLILACRSKHRATNAVHSLQDHLSQFSKKKTPIDFTLEYEHCDLSCVESCREFAYTIKLKYSSIASIVCNAGGGTFTGIDWIGAAMQMLTHPIDGVTYPNYKLQSHGATSSDQLGWVFQMNVFGHFVIVQELLPLLEVESLTQTSSVLWMSSLEAAKCAYDKDTDFDLVQNEKSYEASKYLTEALAVGMDDQLRKSGRNIRSVIVHPGVVWSSIFYEHLGALLDLLMALAFYVARWIGSPHHPISAFLGAISTTHVLFNLESLQSGLTRFGTCCNRWGNAYVVRQKPVIDEEGDMKEYARDVLRKCEDLYRRF